MANCGTRTALHGSFHWTLRSCCSGDLISSIAEGLPLVQRQEYALLACILEIVFPHFTYLAEGPSLYGFEKGAWPSRESPHVTLPSTIWPTWG